MRAAVLGVGATGTHVVSQLRLDGVDPLLGDRQINPHDLGKEAESLDVVILALPAGHHVNAAAAALRRGCHVVSVSDWPDDVDGLLALDGLAKEASRSLIVGAGFAPGLTCLLARHAAGLLDSVDFIAVSKAGTGGPACARQHHRALKRAGRDWVDGNWVLRRGGSGRDLAWFPDPIGPKDCYRGALPSPTLLHRVYPGASRLSARVAANRRDRFTSWLPMLRPPHADGGPGAVRVEVRGRTASGEIETVVYGVAEDPSAAAGTVAAVAAVTVCDGLEAPGAFGLAEISSPVETLRTLSARGLRPVTYQELDPSFHLE